MSFTFVVGCEAENIVVVLLFVSKSIVPNSWHCVLASTGFSGDVDGILHRAVTQPAGVAPVHLPLPCFIQLIKGSHDGVLVSTCSLSVVEIEVVAAQTGEVWEDNTYIVRWETDMIEDQQLGDKAIIYPLYFVFLCVISPND